MATALILAMNAAACASFAPARHPPMAIAEADALAKRAVANEDALDAGKIPARSMSVLPFTVNGSDTTLAPLGYALSAFLIGDLMKSGQFQLVERERLDAIFRELKLVDAGVVDPRTGPRVGRLIGARRVVIGTMTPMPGDQVVLGARVVDVVAGTVQQVTTGSARLDAIFDAQNELALRLYEQLGVNISPALRASVEERETANVTAAVAFGKGLRAEARGDLAAAQRAFEDAARLDAGFAAARTEVANATEKAAAGGPGAVASPATALARVVELTAQGINVPVTTKVPEAADAPTQAMIITLILFLRIS